LVVRDTRFWFAQGLEIDYAVQGDSVGDVKTKFANGLAATIHHHLTIFGSVEGLLKVVPNEICRDLWKTKMKARLNYDSVSIHEILPKIGANLLPFDNIQYCEVQGMMAA